MNEQQSKSAAEFLRDLARTAVFPADREPAEYVDRLREIAAALDGAAEAFALMRSVLNDSAIEFRSLANEEWGHGQARHFQNAIDCDGAARLVPAMFYPPQPPKPQAQPQPVNGQ